MKTFVDGEILKASDLNEIISEVNGKQGTISDLSDIRSGAALGATAVQTETDPTVPSWAKNETKPAYTAAEVGAAAAVHTHAISEVIDLQTSLDSKAAVVHTHAYSEITGTPTIPTATSDLTNDSNFIDGLNGVLHIWQGTEAEYTALTTKSSDTLYLIK